MAPRKLGIAIGAQRAFDKLGPWAESLAVVVIGALFLGVCTIFGIGGPADWATFTAAFLVAATTVLLVRKAARHNAILIEVTLAYLVHGGRMFLDNLLGKLISGQWKRDELKPGRALFEALEQVVSGDDWELKRRVAEALPALGEIDAKRTFVLADILRRDYHPEWRSDLRRRVIESLTVDSAPSIKPLIVRLDSEQVWELLKPRERDEVYTTIAALEVLHDGRILDANKRDAFNSDIDSFAANHYSKEELVLVRTTRELLKALDVGNDKDSLRCFKKAAASKSHYARIAAARNAWRLGESSEEPAMELLELLSQPRQHVNVRRATVKDLSIKFLIRALKSTRQSERARTVIARLHKDQDELVRISLFDFAEALREANEDFFDHLADSLEGDEEQGILGSRLERVRQPKSGKAIAAKRARKSAPI